MKIEELLFRLGQAWEDWQVRNQSHFLLLFLTFILKFCCQWKMEHLIDVAGERLSATALQVRCSSAGEQYRIMVAAVEELLEKVQKSFLELRGVQMLLESLNNTADEMMVKLAWATPFFR